MREYATTWLEHRFDLRPRTVELYEGLLRLHLLPLLGSTKLGDLTTPGLRAWHARMLRSGTLSPNSVAKAYRLLKTILETAVTDGIIVRNPCVIKGAAVERPAERIPATLEQVSVLAGAVDQRYRVLVLMATFTGLRWGELIALTRKRIDVAAPTVRGVEQYVELIDGSRLLGPPKTAAGVRTVAIPPHIVDELKLHLATVALPGPDGLVFPSPDGNPLRRSNFQRRVFQPAVSAAGLSAGFRFHDLRHTGDTLAASTGASTRELMARLGHSSPRAALIYKHATAERDQTIANAISRLVTKAGSEKEGST